MAGIKLKNIHKTYQVDGRAFPVLNGIDLEIPAGKITVILGQSGCGKTTLLRLTGGLESADSGEVLWDGAHKTAFVFQEPRLMPWLNVWDNIIFGLKKNQVDRAKIQDIITTVNLSGFEKAYPSQLSGGMRQRCALIRTMATNPKILLLDEPFSALDFQTRLSVSSDISRIIRQEGKTALLVTHDISEAISLSDRIFVLSARPAVVKSTHDLTALQNLSPLERRDTEAFHTYFQAIWKELDHHE